MRETDEDRDDDDDAVDDDDRLAFALELKVDGGIRYNP